MKPDPTRKNDLAKIHVARKDLGWDDDTYRDILASVCGVRSASALDAAGRKRFLEHLAKCGWKVRHKPQDRTQADDGQSRMLRGLWLELHARGYVTDPSEAALAAWVKRETKVEALQWLGTLQAQQTIEKLKQWRDRDAKKLRALATALAKQGRIPTDDVAELARQWCGTPTLSKAVAQQVLRHLEEAGR